jgi:hypothetical protein
MRTILLGLLSLSCLLACGRKGHRTEGTGDTVCGGLVHRSCAATEYCDYGNNSCGAGDQTGICKPRPQACPEIAGPPTCACDGKTYGNECLVYTHGLDLNPRGSCDVTAGKFACGYLQCNLSTQYCLRDVHAAQADSYRCVELPACDSQPASCACLAHERCGNACTGDANGGLTLTCS